MTKHGKAELMLALVHIFLETKMADISPEQRREIEQKCATEILVKYRTVRELEVAA